MRRIFIDANHPGCHRAEKFSNIDDLEPRLALVEREFEAKFKREQDMYADLAFAGGGQPHSERSAKAITRFFMESMKTGIRR